jgi:hypothetical protein
MGDIAGWALPYLFPLRKIGDEGQPIPRTTLMLAPPPPIYAQGRVWRFSRLGPNPCFPSYAQTGVCDRGQLLQMATRHYLSSKAFASLTCPSHNRWYILSSFLIPTGISVIPLRSYKKKLCPIFPEDVSSPTRSQSLPKDKSSLYAVLTTSHFKYNTTSVLLSMGVCGRGGSFYL